MRPCSLFLGVYAFPFFRCRRIHSGRQRLACANLSKIEAADKRLVENNGLEPLTPCLQGRRSSQLS